MAYEDNYTYKNRRRRWRELLWDGPPTRIEKIVDEYVTRVEADGGTAEAKECLYQLLNSLT